MVMVDDICMSCFRFLNFLNGTVVCDWWMGSNQILGKILFFSFPPVFWPHGRERGKGMWATR